MKLPDRAIEQITKYETAKRNLAAEEQSYINGLATAMDVPDNQILDMKTWEFRDLTEEEKAQMGKK